MSERKVLITDYTWDSTDREAAVLAEVGARLVVARSGDEAELVRLVGDADAILTCFAQVTPAVVRAGEKLRVIGRYGIGVDNIAVDEATRRGIPVTNVPAYCLDEVAEHVLALIFCLERGIHHYDRAVREGDWSLAVGRPIRRIAGRTLGVVGFGKIGRTVAQRAQALGMRVIVHDPRAAAATDRGGRRRARRPPGVGRTRRLHHPPRSGRRRIPTVWSTPGFWPRCGPTRISSTRHGARWSTRTR